MNKSVVLVSLITLALQAQEKIRPDYSFPSGGEIKYDEAIGIVANQIIECSSAQEKEAVEKALEQLRNGKRILQINHKLICAVAFKDLDMVKVFLKNGASVDALGVDGRSALLNACSGEGSFEIAKYLVENRANVNAQCFQGSTALMCASAQGNADIVKLLLENGADTQLKDKKGRNALWVAENQNRVEVVKLLKEKTNSTSKDKESITEKPIEKIATIGEEPLYEFAKSLTDRGVLEPELNMLYKYSKKAHTALFILLKTPSGFIVANNLRLFSNTKILMVKTAKEYEDAARLESGYFKYIGVQEHTFRGGGVEKLYTFEEVETNLDTKPASESANEISLCVTLVRNALYEAWDQPERNEEGSRLAKLYIRLDKSGRISNYRITQSSGSPNFDTTVLKAAANCPLIRGLSTAFLKEHDELTIEFKLE